MVWSFIASLRGWSVARMYLVWWSAAPGKGSRLGRDSMAIDRMSVSLALTYIAVRMSWFLFISSISFLLLGSSSLRTGVCSSDPALSSRYQRISLHTSYIHIQKWHIESPLKHSDYPSTDSWALALPMPLQSTVSDAGSTDLRFPMHPHQRCQ